jgi:hypothetical protein
VADEVSAAKPCGDSISVNPRPIVRIIRHPPRYVPSPIVNPETRITHTGGEEPVGNAPAEINVKVITPIVFCASFVPCASETSEADAVWPNRNPGLTVPRRTLTVIRYAAYVAINAASPATNGEARAGMTIFSTISMKLIADPPAPTHTAPINPPNRA